MKDSYAATPRLLYVALQLFMKQGFSATSVEQICRTTGVSKGAFFHYYRSKDEIALAALDYYWELLDDYLFGGLGDFEPIARHQRVRERFRDINSHFHFQNGSLPAVLAHEVTPAQPEIRERLAVVYGWWTERLADALLAGGLDPTRVALSARHWIAVYEGAVAQSKAAGDKEVVRQMMIEFDSLVLLG